MRHSTDDQPAPGHRFNGNGAARPAAATADASTDGARKKSSERDALKLLLQQFAELREYASYFMATRIDGAGASARSAIIRLMLAALAFVAVAGLVVIASGLVLNGLAQGVSKLLGEDAWIGTLLTGLAALVAVGVAMCCVIAARNVSGRKRMVDKYEERKTRQRSRFGRDVEGRAPTDVAESE